MLKTCMAFVLCAVLGAADHIQTASGSSFAVFEGNSGSSLVSIPFHRVDGGSGTVEFTYTVGDSPLFPSARGIPMRDIVSAHITQSKGYLFVTSTGSILMRGSWSPSSFDGNPSAAPAAKQATLVYGLNFSSLYSIVALKTDGTFWSTSNDAILDTIKTWTNIQGFSVYGNFMVAWDASGQVFTSPLRSVSANGRDAIPGGLPPIVKAHVGSNYVLAIDTSGGLHAWGSGPLASPSVVPVVSNAVDVTGSGSHGLVVRSDGTVIAWDSSSGPMNSFESIIATATGISDASMNENNIVFLLTSSGSIISPEWTGSAYVMDPIASGIASMPIQELVSGGSPMFTRNDGYITGRSSALHEEFTDAGRDYIPVSGTLTWTDGDISTKYVSFSLLGDTSSELDEKIYISGSVSHNGTPQQSIGTTATVLNDDGTHAFMPVIRATMGATVEYYNASAPLTDATWTPLHQVSWPSTPIVISAESTMGGGPYYMNMPHIGLIQIRGDVIPTPPADQWPSAPIPVLNMQYQQIGTVSFAPTPSAYSPWLESRSARVPMTGTLIRDVLTYQFSGSVISPQIFDQGLIIDNQMAPLLSSHPSGVSVIDRIPSGYQKAFLSDFVSINLLDYNNILTSQYIYGPNWNEPYISLNDNTIVMYNRTGDAYVLDSVYDMGEFFNQVVLTGDVNQAASNLGLTWQYHSIGTFDNPSYQGFNNPTAVKSGSDLIVIDPLYNNSNFGTLKYGGSFWSISPLRWGYDDTAVPEGPAAYVTNAFGNPGMYIMPAQRAGVPGVILATEQGSRTYWFVPLPTVSRGSAIDTISVNENYITITYQGAGESDVIPLRVFGGPGTHFPSSSFNIATHRDRSTVWQRTASASSPAIIISAAYGSSIVSDPETTAVTPYDGHIPENQGHIWFPIDVHDDAGNALTSATLDLIPVELLVHTKRSQSCISTVGHVQMGPAGNFLRLSLQDDLVANGSRIETVRVSKQIHQRVGATPYKDVWRIYISDNDRNASSVIVNWTKPWFAPIPSNQLTVGSGGSGYIISGMPVPVEPLAYDRFGGDVSFIGSTDTYALPSLSLPVMGRSDAIDVAAYQSYVFADGSGYIGVSGSSLTVGAAHPGLPGSIYDGSGLIIPSSYQLTSVTAGRSYVCFWSSSLSQAISIKVEASVGFLVPSINQIAAGDPIDISTGYIHAVATGPYVFGLTASGVVNAWKSREAGIPTSLNGVLVKGGATKLFASTTVWITNDLGSDNPYHGHIVVASDGSSSRMMRWIDRRNVNDGSFLSPRPLPVSAFNAPQKLKRAYFMGGYTFSNDIDTQILMETESGTTILDPSSPDLFNLHNRTGIADVIQETAISGRNNVNFHTLGIRETSGGNVSLVWPMQQVSYKVPVVNEAQGYQIRDQFGAWQYRPEAPPVGVVSRSLYPYIGKHLDGRNIDILFHPWQSDVPDMSLVSSRHGIRPMEPVVIYRNDSIIYATAYATGKTNAFMVPAQSGRTASADWLTSGDRNKILSNGIVNVGTIGLPVPTAAQDASHAYYLDGAYRIRQSPSTMRFLVPAGDIRSNQVIHERAFEHDGDYNPAFDFTIRDPLNGAISHESRSLTFAWMVSRPPASNIAQFEIWDDIQSQSQTVYQMPAVHFGAGGMARIPAMSLSPGRYRARITIDGIQKQTSAFTISGTSTVEASGETSLNLFAYDSVETTISAASSTTGFVQFSSSAWTVATPPVSGTVTLRSGTLSHQVIATYVSNASGPLVDQVTIRVTSGSQSDDHVIVFTVADQAPAITAPSSGSVDSGSSTDLAVTITDPNDIQSSLIVTAVSSDQSLIADADIDVLGSGPNYTVRAEAKPMVSGSPTITVRAYDGKEMTTAVISVTVTYTVPNTPPMIVTATGPSMASSTASTTVEDQPISITLTLADSEQLVSALQIVSSTSSQPSIVNAGSLMISGSTAARYVTITPEADAFGTTHVTFEVSDGLLSSTYAIALMITPVNDAPSATVGINQTANEDAGIQTVVGWVTAINPGAVNESTQTVSFSATAGMSSLFNAQPSINAVGTLTFTPAANAFGSSTVAITPVDSLGLAGTTVIRTITVNPINDQPTIGAIGDQGGSIGGSLGPIAITVNDVDGDTLSTTATSSNQAVVADGAIVIGGTASAPTINMTLGVEGTTTIQVRTTDGSLSAYRTFVVTSTNTAPVINGPSSASVAEDGSTSIAVTVGDAETPNSLVVSAASSDQTVITDASLVVSGSGANRSVAIVPVANAFGSASITITVSDGSLTSQIVVPLTVTSVNDAPIATVGVNQTVNEDSGAQTVTGWVTAISAGPANESAQTVSFSATAGTGSLFSVAPAVNTAGTLTFTPAANAFGSSTVAITPVDSLGLAGATVIRTITITPVNDQPAIGVISDQGGSIGGSLGPIAITVNDVDGDTLSTTATSSNQAVVADGSIVIGGSSLAPTISMTLGVEGTTVIQVAVTDTLTTVYRTFVVAAGNTAPTVNGPSSASVAEDGSTSIAVTVGDAETPNGLVVIAVSSDQAVVTDASLVVSGSGANRSVAIAPVANVFGSASITITVSDGSLTAQVVVPLTVTSVNDAPTATVGVDQTVNEDAGAQTVAGWVTAISPGPSNESPQTVLFSATVGTSTLFSVQPAVNASGTLTFTPAMNAFGSSTVAITSVDSLGLAGTTVIRTITVNPINDQPTIGAIGDQGGSIGGSLGPIAITVNDVDGDTLSITATSSNQAVVANGSIVIGGSSLAPTISMTLGVEGTTVIQVAVTDTLTTVYRTFVVAAGNTAPTINGPSSASVTEDGSTSIVVTVGDAETPNSLVVSAVSSDQNLITDGSLVVSGSGANRTVAIIPVANAFGSASITVTVSDGSLTAQVVVPLTITSVNDAPTTTVGIDQTVNEDAGTQTVAGWVTAINAGPANESSQTVSFSATAGTTTLFSIQPAVSGTGILTFTPAIDAFGSSTVAITPVDSLGLAGTTVIRTITVNPINDQPTIGAISDQGGSIGGSLGPIAITVNDVDGDTLSTTATSSNQAVVADGAIVIGGTVSAPTISMTMGVEGTTTIQVRTTDGTLSAYRTFVVVAGNTVPTINGPSSASVAEDGLTNIAITVGDAETPNGLAVSAVSSDQAVVTDASLVVSGSGVNRSIAIAPVANAFGSASITITVSDGSLTSQIVVPLTVTSVNDAPTATVGIDQMANEDAGVQIVTGWVTAISAGPANESAQTVSFSTSVGTSGLFSVQPAVNAMGILTFTPAMNAFGSSTVAITPVDNLGLSGITTIRTITITPINDQPIIGALSDQSGSLGGSLGPISVTVNDVDGDALSTTATSSNQAVVADGAIVIGGTASAPTISMTLGTEGVTTVEVRVSDGVMTTTTSFQVTVVNTAPEVMAPMTVITHEDQSATASVIITDAETPSALSISVTSSHQAVVSDLTIHVINDGSQTHIVFTPQADAFGYTDFWITVSDGLLTTAASIAVIVDPVNDLPSGNVGADISRSEDAGIVTIPLWLSATASGPANENNQSATASVIVGNMTLFSMQPAIDGTGGLVFEPLANAFGSSTVAVIMTDSAGGSATIAERIIEITPVNDPPTYAATTSLVAFISGNAQVIPVMTNVSAGPNEIGIVTFTALSSSTLIASLDVLNDGALQFFTTGATGSAIIQITGMDPEGAIGETVIITIDIRHPPTAPVIGSDMVTMVKGEAATISLPWFDINGDPITASVLGSSSMVSTTAEVRPGFVDVIIRGMAVGTESIVVSAFDGGLTGTGAIQVTIDPEPMAIRTVRDDGSISGSTASGIMGDGFRLSWTEGVPPWTIDSIVGGRAFASVTNIVDTDADGDVESLWTWHVIPDQDMTITVRDARNRTITWSSTMMPSPSASVAIAWNQPVSPAGKTVYALTAPGSMGGTLAAQVASDGPDTTKSFVWVNGWVPWITHAGNPDRGVMMATRRSFPGVIQVETQPWYATWATINRLACTGIQPLRNSQDITTTIGWSSMWAIQSDGTVVPAASIAGNGWFIWNGSYQEESVVTAGEGAWIAGFSDAVFMVVPSGIDLTGMRQVTPGVVAAARAMASLRASPPTPPGVDPGAPSSGNAAGGQGGGCGLGSAMGFMMTCALLLVARRRRSW